MMKARILFILLIAFILAGSGKLWALWDEHSAMPSEGPANGYKETNTGTQMPADRFYKRLTDNQITLPPFLKDPAANAWVDSVYSTMTMNEKIGQLLMVAAYSNKDEKHYRDIDRYVRDYKVGGLIFMQGSPHKQAELTNRYQSQAEIPLMIGFDGEWGLAMRLDSTISYPRQLMLGAVKDNELIYQMGLEIGRQMRRLGVHINFAPVIDVNNNPDNPVINDRSFGDDVTNVSVKGMAYMMGLQDANVLACGKHFPGHGDTDADSHLDLPIIRHSRQRLEHVELKPFKALIQNGLGSVMIAHLNIPSLDNTPNLPSTLSPSVVNGLLRNELGFEGLVFTDAMNMKGITKYYPSGQAEVMALLAGNDVMLFPDNVDSTVAGINRAIIDCVLPDSIFELKVKKVLKAKYWLGLTKQQTVPAKDLSVELTTPASRVLKNKLIESAITNINPWTILPLQPAMKGRTVNVTIGKTGPTPFTRMLDNYAIVDHFFIDKEAEWMKFGDLVDSIGAYDRIIVNIQNMSRFKAKEFGLTVNSIDFVHSLPKEKLVLILFNTPYALAKFNDKHWPGETFQNVIIGYNEEPETQEILAQSLFVARKSDGELPVMVHKYSRSNCYPLKPYYPETARILRYGLPEEAGMDSRTLSRIDEIAKGAINSEAFPGCQVLVARNGVVVYEKAFGRVTYSLNAAPVTTSHLYDIASITKIAGTLPLLMNLYGENKISLDAPLMKYLPFKATSNKRNLTIREILSHQSGLPGWIPFYEKTIISDSIFNTIYAVEPSELYSVPIAKNLYMRKDYIDSIWHYIDAVPLIAKSYKYSDLGMYYMKNIIEKLSGLPLQNAVEHILTHQLGLNRFMYNPLQHNVPADLIIPTEQDNRFRKSLIQGYVHDPGAAMLGGVGGHAGLFANAHDLAVIMQMYLNKGAYGTARIFPSSVMDTFNRAHFPGNRRALGFDKPTGGVFDGPTAPEASPSSFGHQGFTGTVAWADPENGLVFIFLSNRVFPSAENSRINSGDIRQKIQQVAYQAIRK